MLTQGTMTCYASHLARIATHFGIGELLLPLRPDPIWLDEDEEHEANRTALDAMRQAGLLERDGRLDRDFTVTVETLCFPELAYIGWLVTDHEPWQLVTVRKGREAVLAVRVNNGLYLRQITPDGLGEALLSELIDRDIASFHPIRLPVSVFNGEPRTSDGFLMDNDYTVEDEARDTVLELVKAPNQGGGEFLVQTRDHTGRTQRNQTTLGYVLGPHGAWLNRLETDKAGDDYLFCAPATDHAIAEQLDVLHRELN